MKTLPEGRVHIVLYEPEIPPNTGNIARLCACTGCTLHLIHPLGFSIDDKQLKRAGLDYWHHLDIREYASWDAFVEKHANTSNARWFGLSTKANHHLWDVSFQDGDMLIFGPESRGLPEFLLASLQLLKIPMVAHPDVRSLNLSSACSVVVYEALRQLRP